MRASSCQGRGGPGSWRRSGRPSSGWPTRPSADAEGAWRCSMCTRLAAQPGGGPALHGVPRTAILPRNSPVPRPRCGLRTCHRGPPPPQAHGPGAADGLPMHQGGGTCPRMMSQDVEYNPRQLEDECPGESEDDAAVGWWLGKERPGTVHRIHATQISCTTTCFT